MAGEQTETVESDPILAAARQLAAPDPAVTPLPESEETPATEGEVDAEAESEETPAVEAEDEDGTAEDGAGLKALRAAVQADPALALVPEVRERLGLPQVNGQAAKAAPNALVFDGKVPTEEEYLKAYEEKMKAGDEVAAIDVRAERAARQAEDRAVQRILTLAKEQSDFESFKGKHPDWEKHLPAMRAENARQKARGNNLAPEDLWKIVVRPGPAPKSATEAAAQAVRSAAAKSTAAKSAVAASAAAAPTNQRVAGAPGGAASRPQSPADKALAALLGNTGADRKARQLYDPASIQRK